MPYPPDVTIAEARVQIAEAELAFAQWEADMCAKLGAKGSISEREVQLALRNLRIAKARVEIAHAELEKATA